MGIMSKGNQRLSERPLPPSIAERDSDINSVDDSDIVFSLGQKYLQDYYRDSPSTTPINESPPSSTCCNTPGNTSTSSSSPTSATTNNTSLNASTDSDISQEQVKQSYDDVVRLISSYSSLKQVPPELEEKYSALKSTADELTSSISQLRTLSLTFGVVENSDSSPERGVGHSKAVKKGSSKTKTRKKT